MKVKVEDLIAPPRRAKPKPSDLPFCPQCGLPAREENEGRYIFRKESCWRANCRPNIKGGWPFSYVLYLRGGGNQSFAEWSVREETA